MTFTVDQISALEGPLNRANVKKNPKGFDYVEGWFAIAEANRIFGFDGWDRELVSLVQVAEPYEVNGNKRVAYRATVRVTVHTPSQTVIREGTGYGSGIGKDLNDAHESASKEAETDAMKRALMTFGNPFGLALYDKTQANVEEAPKPQVDLITDDQRAIIQGLADAAKMTLQFICESYHIGSLKELPAAKYAALEARLKNVIEDNKKVAA